MTTDLSFMQHFQALQNKHSLFIEKLVIMGEPRAQVLEYLDDLNNDEKPSMEGFREYRNSSNASCDDPKWINHTAGFSGLCGTRSGTTMIHTLFTHLP